MKYEIWVTLGSDATFGRGDGVAGLVDAEVEYDPDTGLPFLRGRTLKGLLVEECANILSALNGKSDLFTDAAHFLFGRAGSGLDDDGRMFVGSATLPDKLQQAVRTDIEAGRLTTDQVLNSLTGIRRQTAVDAITEAPQEKSLRSMRVLLRGTQLVAPLHFAEEPGETERALLAACTLAVHRMGMGRNRGRGRVTLYLNSPEYTVEQFAHFKQLVTGGTA